jgi:ketosteroid isomerase-like protein
MEIEFFSVYTIRDGRVVEQTSFFDRAEAERALEGS